MNNETIQSLRNYALADKAKTTPRTDAATIPFDAKGCERDDRVPVSFARQLERELQQATADNSSLAERLTAAELERDRLGAELEELQGSHDLNQIASDALNDLRADLARMTAERDGYRSDIDRYTWNLAGCDTIASGWGKPGDYDKTLALPALNSVSQMASELNSLRARVAELVSQNKALNALVRANSSQGQGDIDSFVSDFPEIESLKQRSAELVAAIDRCLRENAHLADGDDCTLITIKQALARAKSATPAKHPDTVRLEQGGAT